MSIIYQKPNLNDKSGFGADTSYLMQDNAHTTKPFYPDSFMLSPHSFPEGKLELCDETALNLNDEEGDGKEEDGKLVLEKEVF